MAVSPDQVIRTNPNVTVGEYVEANLIGRIRRRLDDFDSIRDRRLADVLASADPTTRKLLTDSRFRKRS